MAAVLTPEMNAIRVWMRETMERTGWTAQKWATLAGTSPTNITRFLKDGGHLPSTRTVAKLARVAGSAPLLPKAQLGPATATLPVLSSLDHMRRGGPAVERCGEMMSVVVPVSPEAVVFRVGARAFLAGSVVAGDLIVVEPRHVLAPQEGDVVIYALGGEAGHVGEMIGNRVWSLSAGRLTPVDGAVVLAVAVQLVRRLR